MPEGYGVTALKELQQEAEREAIYKAKEIIKRIASNQESIEIAKKNISILQKDLQEVSAKTYTL